MLEFSRLLSQEDTTPYDSFTWSHEDVITTDNEGKTVLECRNAEFPIEWSALAKRTVANKYFRRSRKDDQRETSLKDMVKRVVDFIAYEGVKQKYFNEEQGQIFNDELTSLVLCQIGTFNSPVWFNAGVPGVDKPQGSACFINEVEDDMESILDLAKTEGLIFKEGSGSGVNLSSLRGSNETIRGGGTASGPVSFMQGYDAFANVILSGGRTRRAARMVVLNIDHPDIRKFIHCKADQESVVERLVLSGLSPDFNVEGNAYSVAKHQSGNHSILVTDAFMSRVRDIMHGYKDNFSWNLINRTDKGIAESTTVKELYQEICDAAHRCGDPGLQFYNTINEWNTCKKDGEIVSTNPCGEFTWLKNSSCNLASLNLLKFFEDKGFNTKLFKHAVRTFVIAQDILIEACGYPTDKITQTTHKFRPLGLGYANLGGLLMSLGLSYDSKEGRNLAASITSLMTGQAYLTSSEIAAQLKPFPRFSANESCMEDVLEAHMSATKHLSPDLHNIYKNANSVWRDVISSGFGKKKKAGFRNAQVTLLAPTGTISWMMDCATTGIEPDVGLKKTKSLIDGSQVTYVNSCIPKALKSLGYDDEHISHLVKYVEEHGHLEGSILRTEHLPVFDCAFPVQSRQLSIDAHLNMVAAVQPFLSGAVSKTCNLSHDATVKDVMLTYLKAWERKIKCISVYRTGSKLSEPLRVKEVEKKFKTQTLPERNRLPDGRNAYTHKFSITGQEGFITVGFYPDGRPGELFIRMAQHGSTITGLLDAFAKSCSIMLQYGVSLESLISKFKGNKFIPAGMTTNPDIPMAESIIDYVFKWLEKNYATQLDSPEEGQLDLSADCCPTCGNPMVRTGTCLQCENCGGSQGVCS